MRPFFSANFYHHKNFLQIKLIEYTVYSSGAAQDQFICEDAMMASKPKSRTRTGTKSGTKPTSKSEPLRPDYDTPWKIALEHYFQQFMAFYFPRAWEKIDWQVKYEFLDKELLAITKTAIVGTRHVDKLVKVQLLSGLEDWLYIHIEVQVARDLHFAERMFIYNYRIFDRYKRPVASMAVLGDDDLDWQPKSYSYGAMECEMIFRFPIAKLASFADQQASLVSDPNPFALLTLAYLKNRATGRDMQARFEVKCELVRKLHARDWPSQLIREFFLVIDWMMELPPDLAAQLSDFVTDLEEEQKMEYVSSVERIRLERARQASLLEGEQKGRQEGEQKGRKEGRIEGASAMLSRFLTRRFGNLPQALQKRVKNADKGQIELWFDRAVDALTLDDVFQDLAH